MGRATARMRSAINGLGSRVRFARDRCVWLGIRRMDQRMDVVENITDVPSPNEDNAGGYCPGAS